MARDGQQALEAIRRERPRPRAARRDDAAACRASTSARRCAPTEHVRACRILMLTAKGRDTDVARGIGVGADAYVTKPFSTRDLMQKVREMLA